MTGAEQRLPGVEKQLYDVILAPKSASNSALKLAPKLTPKSAPKSALKLGEISTDLDKSYIIPRKRTRKPIEKARN